MHGAARLAAPDHPAALRASRAVALRSVLEETEIKLVTAAPADRAKLQERAEVLREWLTLKSAPASTQPRIARD